jgi:hypothetical protein
LVAFDRRRWVGMVVARASRPLEPEACLKRLSDALIALALLPALALARAPADVAPSSSSHAKETAQALENSAGAQQTAPSGTSATSSDSSSSAPAAPSSTSTPATAAPAVTKKKNALANAVQARTPEEQANQSGFQFIVALDHYLGAGTFVDASKYSYLSAFLTVIPQYLFGIGKQRLVASATARLAYEYTMPDNETGRKFSPMDTRIGLSAPALFRDKAYTGIAFTPNVGLTIPSSLESWNAGLITAINVGLVMSRSVKTVDFRMAVGGSRAFYTSAQSGVRASDARDENGNLYVVCRSGEPVCGFSNMNPAWSFNIGGQVQWRATGNLLFYMGYTFFKTWRHAATSTLDEFTPKARDANGNPVAAVGLGQQDRTSAFFGASYQLNEHYSLDLGVSTIQSPLHDNGVNVRFPFLSFGAWANNSTNIYFTLTAAY